jgi:O-antigen chain-terminating methyltransferase
MLETNNPDINIADLQEKIELELEEQQKGGGAVKKGEPPENLIINDPYSWGQLSETLKMAELHVNAGAEVTSMLHYRGIVRRIARLAGKITIYLGRVITIPQRTFNSSILHSQRIILDGIRDMNRNTALLERQMKQIEEKSALIDYLKTGLTTQERRISVLLEELQNQTVAVPVDTAQEVVSRKINVPDILDPLYLAFEEKFRGSREEIRERLLKYVPLIREAGAGTEGREILDVGSGRGEWLEIMKDEGLKAKGLDLNHVLVQQCHEKGLEVEENDALSFLRSLPDNSLGAITSFHLIEHISFEDRIALFDESVRVLKSGGVAVFETPNPRNLLVGACNFWADPTHLRPLYPETHQFLMEYRGFSNVELLFLHPHEGEQRLPEEEAPELASRLNEVLSCARDYTIVGYKA